MAQVSGADEFMKAGTGSTGPHCASGGPGACTQAASHGLFWRTLFAQQLPPPVRTCPRARVDARGRRQVLANPAALALYFMEPAAPKNVRDRHDLPALQESSSRAIHLDAYVRQVPLSQDGLYRESGVIIDHSLKLRDQLKDLLIASTDFDSPGAEAFCVYLFGTLLANTPPNLYAPLLGNSNHVPFYFQLLIDSCEAVLNAIRARQAKNPSAATRLKSEKFGILDSPQLLSQDLASASGVLGMACVYLDIDNFKALNTRHSERVVDRDILTPFQRLLSSAVQNIGFAYAEGGDEVTILLPNATAEMAAAWCAGLRSILANRVFPTDGAQVQLSASAGISHTEQGGDRSVLPQQANLAMRKAKELGKDRVCASTADGIQGLSLPKART